MKDVKIVFVDLDGTLRDSEGNISERSVKIMKKLKDIGIYVVFTTGRNVDYTVKLAKQFNPSSYVITSNGAEVYNYLNNRIVFKNPIMYKDLEYLDTLIEKYNVYFLTNSFDKRYTNRDFDNIGKNIISKLTDYDGEINQIVVQSFDKDILNKFKEEIDNYPTLKVINRSNPNLDDNLLSYLDIVNSDCSKGNAIKELCEFLNIKLENTMAIGDSINDKDMLEVCTYKVAMGNASDEIKNLSNYITVSNDQDGVSVVLERLYNELIK